MRETILITLSVKGVGDYVVTNPVDKRALDMLRHTFNNPNSPITIVDRAYGIPHKSKSMVRITCSCGLSIRSTTISSAAARELLIHMSYDLDRAHEVSLPREYDEHSPVMLIHWNRTHAEDARALHRQIVHGVKRGLSARRQTKDYMSAETQHPAQNYNHKYLSS